MVHSGKNLKEIYTINKKKKIVLKNLENFTVSDQVLIKRNERCFFDLPKFVKLQLLELGIKVDNIHQNYNDCTICNQRFHSYRRSGQDAGRQATIISLL